MGHYVYSGFHSCERAGWDIKHARLFDNGTHQMNVWPRVHDGDRIFNDSWRVPSIYKPGRIEGMSAEDSASIFRDAILKELLDQIGTVFSPEGIFLRFMTPEHERAAVSRTSLNSIKSDVTQLKERIDGIRDTVPEKLERKELKFQAAMDDIARRRAEIDKLELETKKAYAEEVQTIKREQKTPEELEQLRQPLRARLAEAEALFKRRKSLRKPKRKAGAAKRPAKKARKDDEDEDDDDKDDDNETEENTDSE